MKKTISLFALLSSISMAQMNDVSEVCIMLRDDFRLGHSLLIGRSSQGQLSLIESHPDTSVQTYGEENIESRLSSFFDPSGIGVNLIRHRYSGLCLPLTEEESEVAVDYFQENSERATSIAGNFNRLTNNCARFVRRVFLDITGERLETRGWGWGTAHNPRHLRKAILEHRHEFQFERENFLIRDKDELVYFLGSYGLEISEAHEQREK